MASRQKIFKQLKALSFPFVFNPYTDYCSDWDTPEAPKIRERNLAALMEALDGRVRTIWFGRDLGYLGGRRTGIALTDEAHLQNLMQLSGARNIRRATNGPAIAERTAGTIWRILEQLEDMPFLWNIFPFHPYSEGNQSSNRSHRKQERRDCTNLLESILEWAGDCELIAIGNDAAAGLNEVGLRCITVRHPSYGGTADFISGMEKIYKKDFSESAQHALF